MTQFSVIACGEEMIDQSDLEKKDAGYYPNPCRFA